MNSRYPIWLVFSVVVIACTAEVGQRQDPLAHPGPWDIPAATRAIADAQHVAYDGAGPWIGEAGCGGALLPGTSDLRHYLLREFPQITGIGGYSCRPNTGATSQTSVHGTGRALDIFFPLSAGDADNDVGDEVANWLIEHTEEIGVQYVIWDRWQWNASRASGAKDRAYTGPHPHTDHIHAEITEEAAARLTPWFSGPMAPVATTPTVPSTCDAATSYSPHFCDDDGHWAERAIQYLHDHGLTNGCGTINGKPRYCPEGTATRAQVLTILGRASEMPTAGHPDAFDDDDGHFAEPYLNAAAALEITNGCGPRSFCPDDDAPRSHVAAFITRIYALPPATRDHFDDDTGSSFEDDHNRLAEAGITSGCGSRRFCGSTPATRAMLAQFTERVHSRGLVPVWVPDDSGPTGDDPSADPDPVMADEEDAGGVTDAPSSPQPTDAGASSPQPTDDSVRADAGGEAFVSDGSEGAVEEPGRSSHGGCSTHPAQHARHTWLGCLVAAWFSLRRRRGARGGKNQRPTANDPTRPTADDPGRPDGRRYRS